MNAVDSCTAKCELLIPTKEILDACENLPNYLFKTILQTAPYIIAGMAVIYIIERRENKLRRRNIEVHPGGTIKLTLAAIACLSVCFVFWLSLAKNYMNCLDSQRVSYIDCIDRCQSLS